MAETYELLKWTDDIIDHVAGIILEEGMPVNARNLNHMDKGISDAHAFIRAIQTALRRLEVQSDLDGRVPDANGTFSDTLDGDKSPILSVSAVTTTPFEKGATTVIVEDTTGLEPLTEVTIYDSVNREDVLILAIEGNVLTVQALKNSYNKGAKVARSTVAIDTTNKNMETGAHVTYSVELVEVA